MSGVGSGSVVGLCYPVLSDDESDVTVVCFGNNFHVCRRVWTEPKWKEIIADTRDHFVAKLIAVEVQRLLDTRQVTEQVSRNAPTPRTGKSRSRNRH
jgi:hypothetical protein